MHIIEFNNYTISLTEEAAFIKPIRDIWNADKSKTKEKALQQLSVIYHFADPRSSYGYILNDHERLKEIIRQEGLPSDFTIEGRIKEAIAEYKKHVITTSSLLLQDLKVVLDNMRITLKSLSTEFTDEEIELKDKVAAMKNVVSIADMIPSTIKKLQDTEKLVNKEIEEQSRARGGSDSLTLFDNGIEV